MKHPDGFQVMVAIDQLVNTLLGGWADETLSARAWRHKLDGSRSWPAWIIDHLFFWQDNHVVLRGRARSAALICRLR